MEREIKEIVSDIANANDNLRELMVELFWAIADDNGNFRDSIVFDGETFTLDEIRDFVNSLNKIRRKMLFV